MLIFGGVFLEDVENSLEMPKDKTISNAYMRKARWLHSIVFMSWALDTEVLILHVPCYGMGDVRADSKAKTAIGTDE